MISVAVSPSSVKQDVGILQLFPYLTELNYILKPPQSQVPNQERDEDQLVLTLAEMSSRLRVLSLVKLDTSYVSRMAHCLSSLQQLTLDRSTGHGQLLDLQSCTQLTCLHLMSDGLNQDIQLPQSCCVSLKHLVLGHKGYKLHSLASCTQLTYLELHDDQTMRDTGMLRFWNHRHYNRVPNAVFSVLPEDWPSTMPELNIIKVCSMPYPVPAQLLGYPSLRELHLPRLQQKLLPDWFRDLAQLTKLTLTSGSFSCFPECLLRLSQLKAARLRLPHFPKQIVQMATWPRLHELDLAIVADKGFDYMASVDQATAFSDNVEALQAALVNRYSSLCVSHLDRGTFTFHLSREAESDCNVGTSL